MQGRREARSVERQIGKYLPFGLSSRGIFHSPWIVLLFCLSLRPASVEALQQSLNAERLRLAENECVDGFFGYKCNFRCRCAGNQVCHKTTGACPGVCQRGFWGPSCQLENSCYYNSRPHAYMGTLDHTGRSRCQRWDSNIPNYHTYQPHRFPDKQYPENYCRTTTEDSNRPWCYTLDPKVKWENCAVKDCSCPPGLFGFNCRQECHCKDMSSCDSRSGRCATGCAEGWQGSTCQRVKSCPPNRYGWTCEHSCQCQQAEHCKRFLGPTRHCTCRPGFFNPPHCEPVTPPTILHFSHTLDYMGEPMLFTCKVKAIPPLERSDVLLLGPEGKQISFQDTNVRDGIIRTNTFMVQSVGQGEPYTCRVKGTAGETSRTIGSQVLEMPRMSRAPSVEGRNDTSVHLSWLPWNKSRGDTGHGDVLNYNVFYSPLHGTDRKEVRAGGPYYTSCNPKCNFVIGELTPNTNYRVFVTTEIQHTSQQGAPSPEIQVRTKCGPPTASPQIKEQAISRTQGDPGHFQMTIEWEDPDPQHFGCNEIVKYVISVIEKPNRRHGPSNTQLEPKEVLGTVKEKKYTIFQLQPLTEYCVVMSMENDAGLRSSPTVQKCQVTEEIAPSPPRNLRVENATSRTAQLFWLAPERPNGYLQGYELLKTVGERGDEWREAVDYVGLRMNYTMTSLRPGTYYKIRVVAENGAGKSSPSNVVEFETSEEPPGPVGDLSQASVGLTEVGLTWSRPQQPNGRDLSYFLVYAELGQSEEMVTREIPGRSRVNLDYTLTGLKFDTRYKIKVIAKNQQGAGKASQPITIETLKPVAAPVQNLMNVSRSSSSFKLSWSLPDLSKNILESILVKCDLSRSLTNLPDKGVKQIFLDPTTVEVLVRDLLPAAEYVCTVRSVFQQRVTRETSISVWTEPPDLKPPTSPRVVGFTDNSVTLRLFESDDRTVGFYRIVVESVRNKNDNGRRRRDLESSASRDQLASRRRRATVRVQDLTHDIHTARKNGETAYVTAEFEPHRLRGSFTVGDNRTYNGYFNGPLEKNREYTFWLVAFSNIDGVEQSQIVKADNSVKARSTGAAPNTSSITVVVGVIVVFILLVLIFAVLLVLWRRRHIAEDREKAEMPSFGPAILPEPESPEPSTPLGEKEKEIEPLIEAASTDLLVQSEPMYTNTDDVYPPIKVEDLWDYIRSAKQNDLEGLKKEFKLLPAGVTAPCEVAKRNENKYKNRYGNIIAYDHTRVLLEPEGDDPSDDYINANYIDGYKKQRVYIAAQGPSTSTLGDIWRMAWKENAKTIIMLTNVTESGKKKCEVYWPETGSDQYGNITVQLLDTDILPDFTIRTFLMSKGGQSKYIKQFHYTTWPDHGVPRFGHSLLLFRQKIRAYDPLETGTLVIHCSAGVGRTGTYISVDTQLEMAKSEGLIDVFNFVHHMRSQRVNMVQTLEQYVFVYDCLLEALICGDTTVASYAFPEVYTELCLFDQDISKTKLEEQFEILKLLSTTIERDESTTALSQENIFKNRCKNIVPANRCRPYLMTSANGGNDYINAVYLNSYVKRDQLLVTQMPLPDTVTDFWRLVYDHKSHCIVMLNEVETNDDTCEQYWTDDPGGVSYGPFHVETTCEIKSNPIITVRDFTLTYVDEEENEESSRLVRQFHFHRWQEGSATPSSHRALLELVHELQAWTDQQTGPVVVHCMNGASRCGVVCATVCILERLQKEKEVDIFQAVKQLRLNRPQLVDNMEQYQFCHELVLDFLSSDSEDIESGS